MKTYYANIVPARDPRGEPDQGRVYVQDDTGEVKPLGHHVYHSPDGHAWGYTGSGPSELAKDILWDLLGKKPEPALYQAFKGKFIAPLAMNEGWRIEEAPIRAFVRDWMLDAPGRGMGA